MTRVHQQEKLFSLKKKKPPVIPEVSERRDDWITLTFVRVIQRWEESQEKPNRPKAGCFFHSTITYESELLRFTSGLRSFHSRDPEWGVVAQVNPTQPFGCAVFFVCCKLANEFALSANEKSNAFALDFLGRDDWIRTSDHTHPMRVFYQAELHPGQSQNKWPGGPF